jgi:ATP-dependent DNA ligase
MGRVPLSRAAGRSRDHLRSRNLRPLGRYFPELVDAFRRLPAGRFIVDGEIIVCAGDRFDFAALLARLHPAASRVERLRRETPALFVAFDVLRIGDRSLTTHGARVRREELLRLLERVAPPLFVTPATDDLDVARSWLERFTGNGIDGVVAKPATSRYEPGKRAITKVKVERTADCVVAGMRLYAGVPLVASLLLGLFSADGELRHVGVASSFTDERRRELFDELAPLAAELEGHPWENGFGLLASPLGRLKGAAARWAPEAHVDWTPLTPRLVCEVAFDQWEGDRFRHPARFKRWRPDRDPAGCTFEQLVTEPVPLGDILSVG